jgi:hypothetical protein
LASADSRKDKRRCTPSLDLGGCGIDADALDRSPLDLRLALVVRASVADRLAKL